MDITGTGPKGTVTAADVAAASAEKQAADAASSVPINIDLQPPVGYLLDDVTLPTQATTSKKELMGYYEKVVHPSCQITSN